MNPLQECPPAPPVRRWSFAPGVSLRDLIEIGIVFVAVILYITSGFNKGDSNSKDVVELAKTVANMATSMRDMDNNGTRYSSRRIAELQKDVDINKEALANLQNSYKQIYDLLLEVKGELSDITSKKK